MKVISVLSEVDDRIILYPLIKMYLKMVTDVVVNIPSGHKLSRIMQYHKNEIVYDNLTITNLDNPTLETIKEIAPYIKDTQCVVILVGMYKPFVDQLLMLTPSDLYPGFYDKMNIMLSGCNTVVQEIKYKKGAVKKVSTVESVDANSIEEYWALMGKSDSSKVQLEFQVGHIGTINKYPSLNDFEMVETGLEFYNVDVPFYTILKSTVKLEQSTLIEASMLTHMTKKTYKLIKDILPKEGDSSESSGNRGKLSGGKDKLVNWFSGVFLKNNEKVSKHDSSKPKGAIKKL